jgi:hypothetical protein
MYPIFWSIERDAISFRVPLHHADAVADRIMKRSEGFSSTAK